MHLQEAAALLGVLGHRGGIEVASSNERTGGVWQTNTQYLIRNPLPVLREHDAISTCNMAPSLFMTCSCFISWASGVKPADRKSVV